MEKEKKRQLIIKVCCIIASFCLWIYISNINNPIKTRVIKNIKVKMINTEMLAGAKFTLSPEQDFTVNLTVKGVGAEIYNIKAEQFNVVADLGAYAIKKGNNKLLVEIKDAPEDVTVLKNESMWVNVEVDDLRQKTVSIKPEIEGNTKNILAKAQEKEATIVGPGKFVDQVQYVKAKSKITEFEETTEVNASLEPVDNNGAKVKYVNIDPEFAKVTLIKQKVEKSKEVKVNLKTTGNLKESLKLVSTNLRTKYVTITGEESTIKKIDSIDTEPIDLSKLDASKKVNVKLKMPEDIVSVVNNVDVDVIIDSKKSVSKTLNIPIETLNLSKDYTAKLYSEKVEVTVVAKEDNIKLIKESDIKATVDLKEVKEGENEIEIKVEGPKNIEKIDKNPKKVQVTVEKKVDKTEAKNQEDKDVNKDK